MSAPTFQVHTAISLDDAEAVAALHAECLPTSVMGRLGSTTLARYYRWVPTSPSETLILAQDEGRALGAAVLSRDPGSVLSRFVRSAPAGFAAAVLSAAMRSSEFRRELVAYVRERARGVSVEETRPEVLQIFVDPRHRQRHIASGLLAAVEAQLTAAALRQYEVRTLADDNASTLTFYSKHAFQQAGERWFCGRRYLVLRRVLSD